MIKHIKQHVINTLLNDDIIDEDKFEIYAYGLDLLISTVISTAFLISIGILLRKTFECILLIILFYTSQSIGGGYHAKTRKKCMICMILGLCISIIYVDMKLNDIVLMIFGISSLSTLWNIPIVLNKNKLYLMTNINTLIDKSRKYTCILTMLFLNFYIRNCYVMVNTFSAALLICACSRLAAIVSKRSIWFNF